MTWEIGEYLMMRSGASGLDLTYENTIQDLAMSLAGAALGLCSWPQPCGRPRGARPRSGWS